VSMQNTIRSALKRRGYRVLVISNAGRALHRFAEHLDEEPLADCVIFSAAELGDDAVDAFNVFGEMDETKSIPAILLVRENNKTHIERADVTDHRIVLPMGSKIRNLRGTLLKLLQQGAPSNS